MATKKITLKLDSKRLPIAQFKSMVSAFFDLVESVSKEADENNSIKWTVAVEEGSQVVNAYAQSEDLVILSEVVDRSIPAGLKILEKVGNVIPHNFNERSIKAVRKLASNRGYGDNIVPVSIRVGKKQTSITSKTIANADELVGCKHHSFGSLEGRLKMLSDLDGGVQFAVNQKLYKRNIKCLVSDELVDQLGSLFRQRVIVSGKIQYDSKGRPINMTVSEIEKLPDNEDLPSLSEMRGLLAK